MMREYWLQLYIKDNYKKLGFDSLEGPFETGYDFKGVYKGRRVVVEAESTLKNFVYHKHDPKEVDILIVLDDDCTDVILGMKPAKWKKRLPKKIIKVDPEDLYKSTHEMRKKYAIKKQKWRESLIQLVPFYSIKSAFATLWDILREETLYEGTPEGHAFERASEVTAIEYLNFYDIDLKELRTKGMSTRIEVLADDLVKSKRRFSDLTNEQKKFLESWLDILHKNYTSGI